MSKIRKHFHSERYEVSYYVQPEHDEWRLDRFMQSFLGTLSREFIKKKIAKNEIFVEGRPHLHRPSTRVKYGQTVRMLTFPNQEEEKENWRGEVLNIFQEPEIVFEDEGLIVISKPPFMTTHPTGRRLFYCATVYFETLYGYPIHSIHRLDRETSGILLLGKNPHASQKYASLFELNEVRKVYFLVAHRKLEQNLPKTFTAKERLSRGDAYGESIGDETRLFIKTFEENSDEGREAQTNFVPLWSDERIPYVLMLAFPKTGRQHQIRVHSAHHGYPLLGDKLYPDPKMFTRFKDGLSRPEDFDYLQIPRHALHAMALQIKEKFFMAPIPHDLKAWIQKELHFDEETILKLEKTALMIIQEKFQSSHFFNE